MSIKEVVDSILVIMANILFLVSDILELTAEYAIGAKGVVIDEEDVEEVKKGGAVTEYWTSPEE